MHKKAYLIAICLISTLGGFLFGYNTAVISGTLTFVRTQYQMDSLLAGNPGADGTVVSIRYYGRHSRCVLGQCTDTLAG